MTNMELLHIQFSNWGMDFTSYMGDVYLPYRTFIVTALVVAVLVLRKRKKNK
jgi:hypothetical protein